MSALTGLLNDADSRRPRWLRGAILALALVTPLVVAGIAVTAMTPATPSAANGVPTMPAAIVNLDTPIDSKAGGKSTPVAAGKLLTQQLVSADDSGFDWTLTDPTAASAGLADGLYSAVVTVPSNFSAAYVSSTGDAPVQAQLDVQTSSVEGASAQALASALARSLHESLATTFTQGFVSQLLVGYTDLHNQLGTAADGASTLASGAGKLATGLQDAATGTAKLDTGAQQLSSALSAAAVGAGALPTATKELNTLAGVTVDGSTLLTSGLGDTARKAETLQANQLQLRGEMDALRQVIDGIDTTTDPALAPLKLELQQKLEASQTTANTTEAQAIELGIDLDAATLGAGVVTEANKLIATGTDALATKTPELSNGLTLLAGGASELATGTSSLNTGTAALASGAAELSGGTGKLASGLRTAADAVPSYTDDQEKTLSTVVSDPIVTTTSDTTSAPAPKTAISIAVLPLALWIGALVLFVLLRPFPPRALLSAASSWRIGARSFAVVAALVLTQAVLVLVWLAAFGVSPVHHVGSVLVVLGISLAFVLLHQGLVALFGRVGWVISLAFIALQLAAVGTLFVRAGADNPVQSLAASLPLAQATRALQALAAGDGGWAQVGAATASLVIAGAVGVALTLVAISRRRMRPLP
ncbi:hypothetical protein [Agreia sp. VKM Ac-1783]|uniref:hypothetical protein n=1 Tax=Agreia sp. VKM Ac-1783 TaxID=1938889 RepID=UPI000A2AA9A5|nr:hypothetical protein [Agreia sp. VKM Ac-1783]SMQ74868.1 putative membrane protein [Agreia sp. VKM Ac-1783]